jgi:hypothetical protein
MPLLVHLAPERALQSIRRNGIKARRAARTGRPVDGVFCMPVLRDYSVSYQWLRELRRAGPQRLYGVHFRVPDAQPVYVGHYGGEKRLTTVGEAIGVLMRQADPRGYELILPRPVSAGEIHRIQAIRQVVGWRFSPTAKGTKPCPCDFCQRGLINSRRIQDRRPEPRRPSKAELLRKLREAPDEDALIDALYGLDHVSRGNAGELAFLIAHPEPRVVEKLAGTLRFFRGPEAKRMLRGLCALKSREGWRESDLERVRTAAAESLVERLGVGARAYLGEVAEEACIREVLDAFDRERAEG